MVKKILLLNILLFGNIYNIEIVCSYKPSAFDHSIDLRIWISERSSKVADKKRFEMRNVVNCIGHMH